MSFLFPLYVLGALGIAIPILLHLRRRPPKDHVPFSSLMFLEKSPERLTRRTRVERWLLLALRCLALILLALMFSRPLLDSSQALPAAGEGRRVMVLIDASASIKRSDLWDRATEAARKALAETGPIDDVAVGFFDDRLDLVRPFASLANLPGSARADALDAALSDGTTTREGTITARPSWRATRLGQALAEAADLVADAAAERELEKQQIVLISDFQEGASVDSLNSYAWPEEIVVRPVVLAPEEVPGNLALHLVAISPDADFLADNADDGSGGSRIESPRRRARITNGRDSDFETFSLAWEGQPDSKIDGFLPAGSSRVIPVPPRSDETSDGTLQVSGDTHDFDNRVFVARAQPRPVTILYLGDDASESNVGSPLFYLSRAMHRTPAIDPSVSALTFEEVEASPEVLVTAQVLVVRTDGKTPPELAKRLADRASAGSLVITIVGEGTEAGFLEGVTGIEGMTVAEAEVRDYAMLSEIDFDSPVLAPFAQAKIRDFTKIHTWRHRELTLPEAASDSVRLLARYDSGAPAWVEVPAGDEASRGSVFLSLSGWEPRESQLALSSKFIPLVYGLLGQAGFSAVMEPTRYVGDPLPLPANETDLTVTLPSGDEIALEGEKAGQFSGTESPGFYTVNSTDAAGREQARVYAINLPPQESRIETTDPAVTLAELGVTLESDSSVTSTGLDTASMSDQQRRRVEAEEKESNQKLWKWLLVAALGILLLETWLAGRRGRATETAAASPAGS